MKILTNYIAGELIAPVQESYIDVFNPSIGEVYAQLPNSTAEDVGLAVLAAQNTFPSWSNLSNEKRADYLRKMAAGIEARMDEFIQAESMDNGKPVALAGHVDIPRAVSNLQFFASAIEQFPSESHHMPGVGINYTTRKPIGIVGCISPWNLPLYLFTWKIAPALAAGNCVIAKPSEITPYTAYLLSEVCVEIGLPDGVFNILHGTGQSVGDALVGHPKIKAISFTGGTATGKHIASVAAPMFKKLSLELGGKNPALVFADCDFEKTVKGLVRSSFANQGQICLCSSRILVERSIYDQFKTAFVSQVEQLKVGLPTDKVNMGALVSEPHLNKVAAHVQQAIADGATLLTGGKKLTITPKGYYYAPTVLEGLDNQATINQQEVFGPVVTLQAFDEVEEALTIANDSVYGLSATIWTNDLHTAHYVADKLETGIVWINDWLVRDLRTPFGGVKASGVGREGGWEALRFFTEPKNIYIPLK